MKNLLKRCPACGRTYDDMYQFFCLVDGSTLSDMNDPDKTDIMFLPPTINSPPPSFPSGSTHTQSTWQSLALLLSAIAIVAVVLGLLTISGLRSRTRVVPSDNVAKVTPGKGNSKGLATTPRDSAPNPSSPFAIIDPENGTSVGYTATIYGKTPYAGLHHYFIVTPLNKGSWLWPAKVHSDGSLYGSVQFGERDSGRGESFTVEILATMEALPTREFDDMPKDAHNSQPITVTRTN